MTLDEALKNKPLIIQKIEASGMLLQKLYEIGRASCRERVYAPV